MGPRRSLRRSAGEGNLGCILWLLVAAIVGYALFLYVPTKINTSQLTDFAGEQAQHAGRRDTAEVIKKRIIKRARELNLEVDPKDIKVQRGRERIKIDMKYTVPLEFPGYTYEFVVDEKIDKTIFIF